MTAPSRPISRRLAVDALHQGIDAADAGEPSNSCPYGMDAENLNEQFAAFWWLRGWRRRPGALDDLVGP